MMVHSCVVSKLNSATKLVLDVNIVQVAPAVDSNFGWRREIMLKHSAQPVNSSCTHAHGGSSRCK